MFLERSGGAGGVKFCRCERDFFVCFWRGQEVREVCIFVGVREVIVGVREVIPNSEFQMLFCREF